MNPSRAQLWLESLGDWAWPGRTATADALLLPPSWVPAFPPQLEPAVATPAHPASLPGQGSTTARRLLLGTLLAALAATCCALALKGSFTLQGILGTRAASRPAPIASSATFPTKPLPTLAVIAQDGAGSTIGRASFSSAALGGRGAFLVYLPPGYPRSAPEYPVLYLLHGQNGHASAFLEVGIQQTLDRLIGQRTISPMIAVMIQDRSGLENWQNLGRRRSATYVVEVQELVDRMLPTIATRAGRAIAGSSMGGFGAMHAALANPSRFAVVESWLGYFDNLDGELRADRPILSRLGLQAFLYGAEADPVARPEEDPAFAAKLRGAGAQAQSAVYPGGHSLGKVRAHLQSSLLFAGRALLAAQRRVAQEESQELQRDAMPPLAGSPLAAQSFARTWPGWRQAGL